MNGSKVVLDTNIVLYLLSGDTTIANFLNGKEIYISVITELELIGYPSITQKELSQIRNFLKDCTIVAINDELKDIYVSIRRKYKLKLGDASVAATALYLDLPFISADKDFDKVDTLQFTFYKP